MQFFQAQEQLVSLGNNHIEYGHMQLMIWERDKQDHLEKHKEEFDQELAQHNPDYDG